MAIKIVRFTQEIPEKPSGITKELIAANDVPAQLNNGAVHVIFVPENLPRCCGLRSSIGECLWTDKSNFRNLFAKEIYKVVRHVRTPSLTIVLQHKTMGGELLTVQYRMTEHDMVGLAGIPAAEDGSDSVFDLCLEITDKMVLQLIDSMSFSIKPSYYSVSDCSVPRDLITNDPTIDGTAPDRLQSAVDDMKSELEVIKDQMYSMARVPADRMEQDYATAKDIIDGKFDKYIRKNKEFVDYDTKKLFSIGKTEKTKDDDNMFGTSKKSWI